MRKLINLVDFSVSLGERKLYDSVNFTLCEGEKYIFLGPNGAGKSLLMELMALGYTGRTQSKFKGIHVSGQMIDDRGNDLLDPRTPGRLCFSYVAQNEEFYKDSTLLEEAETACHGVGIDLDEEKLDYYLSRFGLLGKKKQKIKNNISFGEGKIIHLITRLLKLKKADILLLDEPLNHLSFQNSKVLNEIINEEILNNPKLSIIMISHCRAMSFPEKAIVYNPEKKDLIISNYTSYDCFSADFYSGSACASE